MNNKDDTEFVRTTLWMPRKLREKAKIMAVLTRSSLSKIMISALHSKLKELQDNEK